MINGLDTDASIFVVKKLTALRKELEENGADDASALVLHDVCNALGLLPDEYLRVFGVKLALRVDRIMHTPVKLTRAHVHTQAR